MEVQKEERCYELVKLMAERGYTVERLAERSGASERNLWEWRAQGRKRPQMKVVLEVAKVLRVSPEVLRDMLIRAATGDTAALQETEVAVLPAASVAPSLVAILEDEQRRNQSVSAAMSVVLTAAFSLPEAARQLFTETRCPWKSGSDVRAVALVTGAELQMRYAQGGGTAVVDLAIAMHRQLTLWMREHSYDEDVSYALDSFCGDLCIWIGWIALDAGNGAVAQSFLQEGLMHARMARSHLMEICALNNMSVLHVRTGDPRRARKMAELALTLDPKGTPPRLRSLLHLRNAVASGYLGDASAFRASASLARKEFDKGACDVEPMWFRSFSDREVTGLIGWGQLQLGQGEAAAQSFRDTASLLDASDRRALSHYRVQEARALALEGATSEAAESGLSVLPELLGIRSVLVRQDLHHLYRALQSQDCARSREFSLAYMDAAGSVVRAG